MFDRPGSGTRAVLVALEFGKANGHAETLEELKELAASAGVTSYEVVLGINLTCAVGDKAIYVAEVKQAGVFGLVGFDAATLDGMLGVHCPNVLYPYARQLISELIQAGGFPPFFLQPINFEALYAEGLRQRAAQQAGASLADSETAGNA